MTEWKQSFDRGISNFRSGKYEDALTCFDEVRVFCAPFVWGIDCGVIVCGKGGIRFSIVRLSGGGTRKARRPQGRSRGRAEGH